MRDKGYRVFPDCDQCEELSDELSVAERELRDERSRHGDTRAELERVREAFHKLARLAEKERAT